MGGTLIIDSNCFSTPRQLPFAFSLTEALSDHKVEAVTVSESIPDGVRQHFSSVFMDKGQLTPKGTVSSNGRKLLKDGSFKLV